MTQHDAMWAERPLWLFHDCQRKKKKNSLTSERMEIFGKKKKKSTTAGTVDGNVGRRTAERPRGFGTMETRTALSREETSGPGVTVLHAFLLHLKPPN